MGPRSNNRHQFYTYKIDVFSFALIFYTVYLDKFPYEGYGNKFHFHYLICNNQRPPISDIENSLILGLIRSCWNQQANLRPTFCQIVDRMSQEKFKRAMDVNDEELAKYLSLFPKENDADIPKNPILTQINAEQGDPKEMLNFAIMCLYGNSVPKDISMAQNYFKRASDAGNSNAMYMYAYILYNGCGIPVNKDLANKYFKMAADRGIPEANHSYGVILYNGDGIEENKDEAIKYFKSAADKGNPDSSYIYATLLYNGIGIPQDKEAACIYFKNAADKGNLPAMYNYATMKIMGDNVEQDEIEAIAYYQMASEGGDEEATQKFSTVCAKNMDSTKNS